ncbi:MAG: TadG family pilus assembly protein [Syntrophorhabdaceae bacterium]
MSLSNKILSGENGAVAIYVALTISVFLGIAALAVDIGYTMVGRAELQRTADAAALAATRHLGHIYETMTYTAQQTYDASADSSAIQGAAADVALKNRAGGMYVVIEAGDIQIGTWDQTRDPKFVATLAHPDAVQVTARRDGTTNGPIATFFARIFGVNTVPITAIATAALTAESTSGPGELPIPLGIPTRWFQNPTFCDSPITFYPPCNHEPCTTAQGCAGYHTYTDSPTNTAFLKDVIMPGIPTGSYEAPGTQAGVTEFNFIGGTLAALMNPPDYPFITLFDTMKVRNDGVTDLDTDPTTWTARVIVYESDTCSNPNQSLKVAGYTTIVITNVIGAPNPTIEGRVLCNNIQAGRGGGGNYGTMGSIPGLVQ